MAVASKKQKPTQLERMEKQLANLCTKIYELGECRIQPTWPWVLIRVLPKEQRQGGIILPDAPGSNSQNKPLYEGIVLATWKPHWNVVHDDGSTEEIWRESDFVVGDRVLYPHFAGLPVKFLDPLNYRLVREWTFDPGGGVQGIVHYDGDKKIKEGLDKLFKGVGSVTLSGR